MDARWIFFDFDGVIADSESISLASWRALLRDPDAISLRDICGNTALENARNLAHLLRRPGSATDVVAEKLARDRDHIADFGVDSVSGVGVVIAALSQRFHLAVVSSNARDEIDAFLSRQGLCGRFAFVCSPSADCLRKPAPDLYLAALRHAGCAPTAAVAIEDSPAGIQAARGARVPVIAFGPAVETAEGVVAAIPSFDDADALVAVVDAAFEAARRAP